ncbi:MAG: putative DNA-binding domain-containing protein [Polaromonas sp.]|uniref:HvfC/BufC family peptide modification chaperone n=1 Tax=Polaromonas sp. TaxID=1869339 RepID=UPI0027324FC5|nr:putative DNA-binding domain-containing protein [Polaromonas sp.]MDP3250171.1 putative DNA-binding domain-containing protein [Polaromonas sp.]
MSATTGLAAQQQALLQALYRLRHVGAMKVVASCALPERAGGQKHLERGLQAYRSNGHALARRALAAAYPVVAELMGAENFVGLSRHFWQSCPPARGDMAQWGEGLAAFLASLLDLAREEPYLPDVARVEWALHVAATQADGRPDIGSLALLESGDPAELTLQLCPGVALLASDFPVVSMVLAHLTGTLSLQQAGERLRDRVAETALVWRQGLKPALRHAQPGETLFVEALRQGRSLGDALYAAPGFDFAPWLAPAVHAGLLLGARPVIFSKKDTP